MGLLLFVVEVIHVDQTKLHANAIQFVEGLTDDFLRIGIGKMMRLRELLLQVFDVKRRLVQQGLESDKPLAMCECVHGLPFRLLHQGATSVTEVNAIPL